MAYLLGTDEAGYGPNLGPLVIGASLWEVPELECELYETLDGFVQREPSLGVDKLAIADSKRLYSPGGKLSQLERGVLAALSVTRQLPEVPSPWQIVFETLAPGWRQQSAGVPWYEPDAICLPLDAELAGLAETWSRSMSGCGVRLLRLQAAICLPREFNQMVDAAGSKGAVLSRLTLRLVQELVEPLDGGDIRIHCDKHGGRNKYSGLLHEAFPGHLIEVLAESRARSDYRWGASEKRFEAGFVAKGESFLPSALASMVAKYLREVAMRSFNSFWRQYMPELKPTAGYPQDAKRFRAEIAETQRKLGIADELLWRNR